MKGKGEWILAGLITLAVIVAISQSGRKSE